MISFLLGCLLAALWGALFFWRTDGSDAVLYYGNLLIIAFAMDGWDDWNRFEMKKKCCEECPGDDTCEHAKVCMCGSHMEDHDIGSGHSPVSMHDYYCHDIEFLEKK